MKRKVLFMKNNISGMDDLLSNKIKHNIRFLVIRISQKDTRVGPWLKLITVSFDGVTDTFDFTGLPDGEIDSSMVETVLEHNPIIRAKREAGVLSVEIMNFIPEDAQEADKFPEWIEV